MNKNQPIISIIVAVDANNLIGNKNTIPWKIPGELTRFRSITMDKPIIMGRKTHESIGKILDGRINIILTKNKKYKKKYVHIFNDFLECIKQFSSYPEIMIIGGSEIYNLALPYTNRIYMTQINSEFVGDTWFPNINKAEWNIIEQEQKIYKEKNISYSFLVLQRINV